MVQINSLFGAVALYSAVALAAPGMPMDMGMTTTSTAMMADKTAMQDMTIALSVTSSSSSSMMETTSTSMMMATTSSSTMMGTTSTSAAMKSESTSSTMMSESSSTTMMTTSSSSMMAMTTSTSSMAMPTYGSGSANWGNTYNDCVQQCVAQFGSPAASYTPTATATQGSKGTGATHTIIVAPSQGVLRYVPFAVNASVGDTVQFMWGANVHTVTKGSSLELCNKTGDAPFASGLQNKSFVFEQVVNDTKPTFFFCGAPTHCQKGMFGIINPSASSGAAASIMGQMAANSTDMAAMTAYSKMMTKSSLAAGNWGSNINLAELPEWSKPLAAANIMYTRMYLAANKELIAADGKVDLGAGSGAPMAIPQDITAALNAAGGGGAVVAAGSAAPSSAAPTVATAAPSGSTTPTAAPSSAGSVAASGLLVAFVAVAATLFSI